MYPSASVLFLAVALPPVRWIMSGLPFLPLGSAGYPWRLPPAGRWSNGSMQRPGMGRRAVELGQLVCRWSGGRLAPVSGAACGIGSL